MEVYYKIHEPELNKKERELEFYITFCEEGVAELYPLFSLSKSWIFPVSIYLKPSNSSGSYCRSFKNTFLDIYCLTSETQKLYLRDLLCTLLCRNRKNCRTYLVIQDTDTYEACIKFFESMRKELKDIYAKNLLEAKDSRRCEKLTKTFISNKFLSSYLNMQQDTGTSRKIRI